MCRRVGTDEDKHHVSSCLGFLESAVKDASRRDIHSLIRSMKEYKRGVIFTSKFAKLAKHLSEKLEAEISNHEHPYTIGFPPDVEISYMDRLGEGSFGTVYKCTFLGVMAAAKVWKTNCMNKEAAEKEAHLSSKLRHQNVVQFIGYGVKQNQPVIISELMRTDLRRYLDEKKKNAGEGPPLPLLVAMNILIQIAEAMNYLHENGVMHRDLKANNVLINVLEGPDGQLSSSSVQVKLTDFGESKLKLHDSGYTTPMVGATRWRAPEVFEVEENREKYTKSADVYSFSMLCFEVLTGDVPFKDKPLTTLLQSIRDGVRPQLPDVDYCPDYLSALIEKCWATNAVERPQFPVILQLLMDYKARVLKHPYWGEDLPPDSSQDSQAVDIAHTADTICVIEDDNNHRARKSETEISNHEHPYVIDIPLDVEISYQDSLGSGSFGTVFKCTFLGVMAAAKVFCTEEEAAEKQASLFSKLRHPNVAEFIGYGVKGSQPVIVLELMSTDLRRYLNETNKNAGEGPPLPLLVAMNILIQIAEAMNYLHENAVMHLDLKARNVLMNVVEGPDGQLSLSSVQVKLHGFDQSELNLEDSGYTRGNVGTTQWRALELFDVEENKVKYTKSADVYSFSMLCFEVLTGDVPFKDKLLTTLLQSIRDGVRPQLPDVDYCPDYLSALIEKCWATNAVERPQFPVILQLLIDYKARVLKHPYWEEDLPPDSSQHSQTVDIADTADTICVIEDDNNHCARKSATSLLQQVQSLSVD
ncbi:hypothetical protein CY35_01G197400 [Sphagnum magellanicum]|nr:hypothetical protein CY35_01G197400 [Sphagnum magellanicum]